MAMWLNESTMKAGEEARQKEMQEFRKQVKEEIGAKEAKFQNELAQEKVARQRDKENIKNKISKFWRFFKSQQAGPSTTLPDMTPAEDDDEDKPDTTDNVF